MKIIFKKTFGVPGPSIKLNKDGSVTINHNDNELQEGKDYEISELDKKSKTEITLANGIEVYLVNE